MKPLILVVGCLFLPLQTFSYLDCCCGDFCTHQNACSGCEADQEKPCDVHPNHQAGRDCCLGEAKAPVPKEQHRHKACAHLSPSSEVTSQAGDSVPVAPSGGDAVLDLFAQDPLAPTLVHAFLIEAVPRAASDVPRHLLLSVLQV